MSLQIIAAKDIDDAFKKVSTMPKKEAKNYVVDEFEGIGDFLYDIRNELVNYDIYYRFDPYRETVLEASLVCKIKTFSESILQWIAENSAKENTVIQKYGISLKKIKAFAMGLNDVCDIAIKNNYDLVGFGD